MAQAELWTQVDGLKFRFEHAGQGPPLVLVHGLMGCSFCWRHVIPAFACQAEVFAPDMPGHGLSEYRRDLDCRLQAAARRLAGFLDAVGIDSCDLVGSSYGGATALALASLAPARVRRLVLVSPVNPWSKRGRIRLALLGRPSIAAAFLPCARSVKSLDGFFLRRLYGDPRHMTRDTLLGYQVPLRNEGTFRHALGIVRSWRADLEELKSSLPRLAAIPTLIIWGNLDRAVDPASAPSLMESLGSGTRLAVIEGAGHLPFDETPEQFSGVVSEFLWKSAPRRDGQLSNGRVSRLQVT